MKYEKDIILFISSNIFERMKNCVKNTHPNEAFGLILGPKPREVLLNTKDEFQYHYFGEKFECIESSEKSPVSFLIDNTIKLYEIMDKSMKKYDRRVLSIFHSHPSGNQPSGSDIKNMKFLDSAYKKLYNSSYKLRIGFKNQIWLIMDSSNYDLNGFIYLEGEILQIVVKIK